MERMTAVMDVVIRPDGTAYVETETGEDSGIRPRCMTCRYSSVQGCAVVCTLGVSQYAEVRRKLGHTKETARTWSPPEYESPHITEKDASSGNYGKYQVTSEMVGRGGSSTLTIREIIQTTCVRADLEGGGDNSERAIEATLARIKRRIALIRPLDPDTEEEVLRLIKVHLKATEDIMDLGTRFERHLNNLDEVEETDIARRWNRKDPILYREEVARENYSPPTAYHVPSVQKVVDPETMKEMFAEERVSVNIEDPGFHMPVNPGKLEVRARCFPQHNHFLCPLVNREIPFRRVTDRSGFTSWKPDVERIREIASGTDSSLIRTVLLMYRDRILDVIAMTKNRAVLTEARKLFSANVPGVAKALEGHAAWELKPACERR